MTANRNREGFVPVPNPFITGNPVRNPNLFFGREEDFEFARTRLSTEKEGGVILFVGERRSGKTSVLFQILNGRLGSGFLPVFVDMQALAGVVSDAEFFERFAGCVCVNVADERIEVANYDFRRGNPTTAFDRLLGDVQAAYPESRLIFLFDEVEILQRKVALGQLTGDVLVYLAAILESRRLYFFLTGSRHLGEAQGEEWRRLIAKATYREITFLVPEDTIRLIRAPVEGKVFYGRGVIPRILRLTSGHPYYTQVICTNIVDYLNGVERNTAELADLDEVVQTIVDNPPPSMVHSWDELSTIQQMSLSLLSEESPTEESVATPILLEASIQANGYPLSLTEAALHGALESLYQLDVLQRTDRGGYRFRVYLFSLWIGRARSIWRLVKEGQSERSRRRVAVVTVLSILTASVGIAGWLAVDRFSGKRDEGMASTGNILLETVPDEVQVLLDGKVRAHRSPHLIPALSTGEHTIEIRRPGYHPQTRQVQVIADSTAMLTVLLKRVTGLLSVAVSPKGASVEIEGEVSVNGLSPLDVTELPAGIYRIRVDEDGYVTQDRSVTIDSAGIHDERFDLMPAVGGVVVTSDPPGAEVTLDGSAVPGRTPVLLDNRSVGQHRLRLELADHASRDTVFAVRLNRMDTIACRLEILPGTLVLYSDPTGASVYAADTDSTLGRTPLSIELKPGSYGFGLALTGYDTCDVTQQLRPGKADTQRIALTAQWGWIRIVSPRFGTIRIDGEELRKVPPGTIRLQAGVHTLQDMDGGDTVRVTIRNGETLKKTLR